MDLRRARGAARAPQSRYHRTLRIMSRVPLLSSPFLLGFDEISDPLHIKEIAKRRRARFTRQMTNHPHKIHPTLSENLPLCKTKVIPKLDGGRVD